MAFAFKASRKVCAMAFASRKSRMRTPLHRRTEKIGACLADPFANGEGRIELIRSPSPKGAGGGCIDLVAILAQGPVQCQSKTCADACPCARMDFAIFRGTVAVLCFWRGPLTVISRSESTNL